MYYYLNQTNYPHVAYPTLTDIPELMRTDSTVRSAGCGLCSASMVVTNLTGRAFSLIDCLELSLGVKANHSPGTDMDLLAPYVAERFDLDMVATDDPELLREHLKRGGMAVANVTGDRPEDGHVGLFSHGGHYVAVVGIEEEGETVIVLDPSQLPDKFHEEGREGKVIENGCILRTSLATLAEDCKYRAMEHYPEGEFKAWMQFAQKKSYDRYYLFSLKGEET